MADPSPATPPLRLIEAEPAGYCDPVTGVCVVPQTPPAPDEPDSLSDQ